MDVLWPTERELGKLGSECVRILRMIYEFAMHTFNKGLQDC